MSANDWMAQDIANLLDLPVERPDFVETTALGAAKLAAVGCAMYPDLTTASAAMRGGLEHFKPRMEPRVRKLRLANWERALAAV